MSISQKIRSADALLSCLDAVRNGPALGLLLGTFSISGLLLAMTQQAAARGQDFAALIYGLLALGAAFYGGNAAGIVVMDDAKGRPRRAVGEALKVALRTAHRLLGVLALTALAYAVGGLLVALVLLVCKTPVFGPLVFTLVLPLAVVACGLALLALPTVIMPLAAPAVWDGASTMQCASRLFVIGRERLLGVVVMMLIVSVLAWLVGAMVMFVVQTGGHAVARLAAAVLGADVALGQMMAGLFGVGLRSLTSAGVPVSSPYAVAALIGGGVVFAVSLVLPSLVYLRGACAVYLAHVDAALAHEQPAAFRQTDAQPATPTAPVRVPAPRGILAPPPQPSGLDTTITMARSPLATDRPSTRPLDVDLLLDDLQVPTCAVCGHVVQRNDRFCGVCGAPQPAHE
ncbi:zinc ribbon domain-containing protein [Aquabacterium sp. A7-Y]|uniref:zinc ribbon domain-containing protein n=1 Tax=Aquabacterium sp. A7-Y TaxID=1349605 RepID=UPI00223CC0AA|nr:zinc ribbon domain-containing protein [Aquabacterium sp. A7-Y]MCW7538396.1 zinc ribbon domain-containing protein [Aquabacterium sp. A7-Y]